MKNKLMNREEAMVLRERLSDPAYDHGNQAERAETLRMFDVLCGLEPNQEEFDWMEYHPLQPTVKPSWRGKWMCYLWHPSTGVRIRGSLCASDWQEAKMEAENIASGVLDGITGWHITTIEPMEDLSARELFEKFSQSYKTPSYPCPCCGKTMIGPEIFQHTGLTKSLRCGCNVCKDCADREVKEIEADQYTPLAEWAIVKDPERWEQYCVPVEVSNNA